MSATSYRDEYTKAYNAGLRDHHRRVAMGGTGNLPFLEGIVKNSEIVSEVSLGVVEIPLRKVVGTWTYARAISFSSNFLPLMKPGTEFSDKWTNLCKAHIEEGIHHPIKVYEYLNWFYAIEGNKRVSVLKYHEAYSIHADVIRLVPRYDANNRDIRIYYEFLDFYRATGANELYFSREGGFRKLLRLLEREAENRKDPEFMRSFMRENFLSFRMAFKDISKDDADTTTADAFLKFLEIYGFEAFSNLELFEKRIRKLLPELKEEEQVVLEASEEAPSRSLLDGMTGLLRSRKKLKTLFVYSGNPRSDVWTASHDAGRRYAEKYCDDIADIHTAYDIPDSLDGYPALRKHAHKGYDIVFLTSPGFLKPAIRAALDFRDTRFLVCSERNPYHNVGTYAGRLYEPRFLTGLVAGAMSASGQLGYIASSPSPGVLAGLNAFAAAARMINPRARVRVEWLPDFHGAAEYAAALENLAAWGAEYVSHYGDFNASSAGFGLFPLNRNDPGQTDEVLAAPLWHWGAFYKKMLEYEHANTSYNLIPGLSARTGNTSFLWGIGSGVVDVVCDRSLVPASTQHLVSHFRQMIADDLYQPFTGPMRDTGGQERIPAGETLSTEDALSLNWLHEAVESPVHLSSLKDLLDQDLDG